VRILFLSHYFPPEVNAPASRTFEHCREWVRQGHEVTVVTCAPNHPRGVVYEGYRNRLWQREARDGIRVVRLWTYLAANEGFAKRTLNYVSYMVSAVLAAPWLPRADVVVTTSPQFFNGLAGYFVSRLKRAPWALEIRDLWPESILSVGAIKNARIIRALEWLERFAYRKADVIVPVTDAFKRYMVERGVPAEKIHVIKNGVDLGFYRGAEGPNPLAVELGLEGKFVAAYVGTHGMAHHLETVLEAAERLRPRKDIVFLMAGDGAERDRLLAKKEAMGLENVLMLAQQPKGRMPEIWALTGASLVLLKRSDTFKTVIPSKIFESMAMKRPIVLGVEGESRELVASAEAGLFIEPENATELAAAVVRLADDRALRARLGENGRRFVERHFDRRVLAKRYVEVFQGLVTGTCGTGSKDATRDAAPGGQPAPRPSGEE
jgi:glycosyltransferase involved in cell wall biosynthesis